jgi:parvulin-like peptidyl-prolyl cis-trans isomerase-like protein
MDEVILAQSAVELGLQNDHEIARLLISNRRSIFGHAMRNLGILANQEPSEDDIQDHYIANRARYKKKGIVQSRHVECLSRADADQVYARLMKGGWENRFTVLVKEHSVNQATAAVDGVLGWFNEGGYVPDIRDAKDFTKQAYALQDGINPPFASGGRWHVVEVLKREYDRGMTLAEARPTVLTEMIPGYQRALVDDYLTQARKSGDVRMVGVHAPGQGLSAEQLFGRARVVPDGELKMELFEMVFTDFPESDRADDALFLSANLALDGHGDRRLCAKLLTQILDDYPDSELIADSRYLLQNMDNPQVLNPTSIEDLRR